MQHKDRGAALVIGLIMLVLITLMLVAALNMSTTNFRAVSNMQFRDEAIAAANKAIEQVITNNDFTGTPDDDYIAVDIDDDGTDDYNVHVAPPICVSAAQANEAVYSDITLGPTMSVSSNWNTVWELDTTVTDAAGTGATARVHAGVRALLSSTEKATVCP
jgi:Tfp pilus assembly protein PilX